MSKKTNKNSFSKSIKFIISQAMKGSKLHIAIIAAALLAVLLPVVLIGCSGNDEVVDEDKYV